MCSGSFHTMRSFSRHRDVLRFNCSSLLSCETRKKFYARNFFYCRLLFALLRQISTSLSASKWNWKLILLLFYWILYSSSNSDDSKWRWHVNWHTRWRGSHAPVPLQPGLLQPRIHLLLGSQLAALRKRRRRWEIAELHLQVSNERPVIALWNAKWIPKWKSQFVDVTILMTRQPLLIQSLCAFGENNFTRATVARNFWLKFQHRGDANLRADN